MPATLAEQRAVQALAPEFAPELARRRGSGERQGAASRRRGARAASRAQRATGAQQPHTPVMAGELLAELEPRPGQTAIDCTFGDGGHARLMAERLGPSGTLIAIDRDPLAERSFAMLAAEHP